MWRRRRSSSSVGSSGEALIYPSPMIMAATRQRQKPRHRLPEAARLLRRRKYRQLYEELSRHINREIPVDELANKLNVSVRALYNMLSRMRRLNIVDYEVRRVSRPVIKVRRVAPKKAVTRAAA